MCKGEKSGICVRRTIDGGLRPSKQLPCVTVDHGVFLYLYKIIIYNSTL